MELTPTFVRMADGTWQCLCPGTAPAQGASPEQAYARWLDAFRYHIDPDGASG